MGLVTALLVIAAVATIASATLSIITSANPPKPGKINFGFGGDVGGSPRYGTFGPLDNTVSNELAIPALYGQQKLAGNVIWQTDAGETVSRVVGLCEGLINDISDVRANDIVMNATNLPSSSFTTYLGTGTQQADSRVTADVRPNLEMHHLAYIALTLVAENNLKGGNPTITCVAQGLLVETWSGGAWQTTKAYSRNPAACIRDFLLSSRYGLGVARSILDDDSFGEVYDYCEELVDSSSGKEARFRIDYILDVQRPAQDTLNDMLATFMGFLVYAGNKIKLKCEKPEVVTQYFGDGSTSVANSAFDPNNIVRDSFQWNMSSIDDRPNRIRLQWVDPSQNYVKIYTQVEDRIDQDTRNNVIGKDISLLGITRQTQASRMAKIYMSIAKYAAIQITFAARLESIHCEIGDVVAVTHQSARFVRRLFRITDMQEGEDETIRFVCREYNASIYDDKQATTIVSYDQPTGPNLYAALSDVTNLSLLEDNFKNKDGVFVTNITASWTAISADQLLRLDRYLIQLSLDGGATYRDVAFVSNQRTSYKIVLGNVQTGTTFVVRVKTVSDRGAESTGTTGSITIQGKSTPPSDVEDFSVVFSVDRIAMSWSAIDDEDLFAYEIRQGNADATWETAGIVVTELLTNKFDLFDFTVGAKRFFVKAIDNSANYSANAAAAAITITSIPASNVVFSFDIWSRVSQIPHPLEGTLSSDMDRFAVNDYDSTYNRLAFGPKTAQTFSELQSAYSSWQNFQDSAGFVWGRETYVTTEESYTTEAIDLGATFTGSFIIDFQGYSSSNLGVILIDISTSTDNITYTSYVSFAPGQYTARYVKFRFKTQATNPLTRVRISAAYLTVDVPDRDQSFLNQFISSAGTTITLTGFTAVKSIVITTVGSSNYTPRISNQGNLPNSFTVVLFDTSGVLQNGSCNIYCKGY